MPDLILTTGQIEACRPDKPVIRYVFSHTAIHYILSGGGWFNGQKLHAGQGFLCLKDHAACYYPDPDDPWEYLWIRLEGSRMHEILNNLGLLSEPRIFSFQRDERILSVCRLYLSKSFPLMQNELLSEGLARLILSVHQPSVSASCKSVPKLHAERAAAYIRANYHRKLHIDTLADEMHLSRAYLRNVFSEEMQMSPQEYLIRQRIIRAQELLRSGSYSISEIAASVSYDDVLQFSRIFKKYTGLSPSAYRKQAHLSVSSDRKAPVF